MTQSDPQQDAILSSFSNDPDMVELIQEFVAEMPDRIAALQQAFESQDAGSVARIAHQLKGSGGGYGFDGMTSVAAELEQAAARSGADDLDAIRDEFERVVSFCSRIAVR